MQCAILCGGLGSRLGALTARTPKPLLPVDGAPFLETLVFELGRQGVRDLILLAAFQPDQIKAFADASPAAKRFGMKVRISIEPDQAGTGGALWHARDLLDEQFLLLNGDTWFDISLSRLTTVMRGAGSETLGAVALRHVDDASRYGAVLVDEGTITSFSEKNPVPSPGFINGGVYCFARSVLDLIGPKASLEAEVLTPLARQRRLQGVLFDGAYFIDIGIPTAYAAAQHEIPARRRRPAAFLDRDGVINRDLNYVGSRDRVEMTVGAGAAIARLNRAGYYVFVVTNQAGIGHGYYTEDDHHDVMAHIADRLALEGAHFDDQRFCAFHPEAKVERFRGSHGWRKPQPGMLLDLIEHWPVDVARSFVIGDRETDIAAGAAAGVRGYLFQSDDLDAFVSKVLEAETHRA